MKFDRIQDLMRFIIPGLYLLSLNFVFFFDDLLNDEGIVSVVKELSALIIVLLPFVAYVIGLFLDYITSWLETFSYHLISRPSRKVLHGNSNKYKLASEYLNSICQCNECNTNSFAHDCQVRAKQAMINNEVVNSFYYLSIMCRHIAGAQLIATAEYFFVAGSIKWWMAVILLIASCLACLNWYHQACIYMKYLFAEYAKTLK